MLLIHYASRRCGQGLEEMGAGGGGFRFEAVPEVRIQALSPLVYLTRRPALCSFSSPLPY